MNEHSSLPPQIAEWFWCIEIRQGPSLHTRFDEHGLSIPPLMTMEAASMKSCLLQSWSSCLIQPRMMLLPRIEFDLSLSSTHVLNAILKHITLSELRPGMPELSKFMMLVPFIIARKNMSLPQCALEKLRDVSAMENNLTSAAPTVEVNDPVYRDHQPEQMDDACEEMSSKCILLLVLEQANINDKDKIDADDEGDEVIVVDDC